MNDPVLILGCGAMACLFAARLALAGQEVWLLDEWEAGIQEIQKNGIHYHSQTGLKQATVHAVTDPADCPRFRDALILVKSWQTATAARMLNTLLLPDGIALSLQNGLGNLEMLSSILGPERVSAGVTTLGATLTAPGVVHLMGEGEIVMSDRPELDRIAQHLTAASITHRHEIDIRAIQWSKLLVNAAINPITALLGVPNGVLLENAPAQLIMRQVLEEALQIAEAENITLPFADPLAHINSVLTITAKNRSSMLQDLARGAPTEINQINGALVSLGNKWKIPTPVNQTLLLLILARVVR